MKLRTEKQHVSEKQIFRINDCLLVRDSVLAPLVRFGTGGKALFYAEPTTIEQVQQLISFACAQHLPCFVLGWGCNMLVSDAGVPGLVLRLSGDFKKISFDHKLCTVTAGGGVPLIKLGLAIARRGYGGCAYMGVIPGTVGGAVRMNAGIGPGQEIQNHFVSALLFDTTAQKVITVDAHSMAFGYRSSLLVHRKAVVLSATFQLPEQRASGDAALQAIRQIHAQRRQRQPKNWRTFGSVFQNPAGAAQRAGWYLERVGMKGMAIGGALVPHEHANWIINTGTATSKDAQNLIAVAQQRVFEKFGILLEREVVYMPEDLI